MASLPDPPAVSCQTVAVTGILVDVYGLDELPPDPTHVSVVWLHNPRLGDRSRMAPLAKRMVGEHTKTRPQGTKRGLIAAAFGTHEPQPASLSLSLPVLFYLC